MGILAVSGLSWFIDSLSLWDKLVFICHLSSCDLATFLPLTTLKVACASILHSPNSRHIGPKKTRKRWDFKTKMYTQLALAWCFSIPVTDMSPVTSRNFNRTCYFIVSLEWDHQVVCLRAHFLKSPPPLVRGHPVSLCASWGCIRNLSGVKARTPVNSRHQLKVVNSCWVLPSKASHTLPSDTVCPVWKCASY